MSQQNVLIEQILRLTEQMLEYGRQQDWTALLRTDTERNMLVQDLRLSDSLSGVEKQQLNRIDELQNMVIEIVVTERSRIRDEYLAKKGMLEVSNNYLGNSAKTLTR